ncbi:hypothetical protein LCGC14_1300210, partial [marine sediment metagenome]
MALKPRLNLTHHYNLARDQTRLGWVIL